MIQEESENLALPSRRRVIKKIMKPEDSGVWKVDDEYALGMLSSVNLWGSKMSTNLLDMWV